MYENFAIKFS